MRVKTISEGEGDSFPPSERSSKQIMQLIIKTNQIFLSFQLK